MTRDEARALVRRALQDRTRLVYDEEHFFPKLQELHLDLLDALNALQHGKILEDPKEEEDSRADDTGEDLKYRCADVRVTGRTLEGEIICVLVKINPVGQCICWTLWRV